MEAYYLAGAVAFALIFASAFFVILVLFLRARKNNPTGREEVLRLQAELENVKQVAAAKEENLINRIKDKEDVCRQLISSKEESFTNALHEKDMACEDLLRAKDNAHANILAEKDQVLKQMTISLQSAIAEKDRACNAAITEKERTCEELIKAKEQACAEIIAEKDAALARKDAECQKIIAEKERTCEEAIKAKGRACAEIIAEKDAALVRKDTDCKRMLEEKNAEIAKFLKEKEASFAAVVEALKEKFSNIALEQMKAHSEGLSKVNKANMDVLLGPVRDQVKLLQELAEKAQKETHALGVSMTKDVLDMGKIAKSLQGVAEALSSNTRFQGRKGEEILAEKLRQAGLEENVNFFLQRGTDTERPDTQVRDTEYRSLRIVSKVSLTAYMEYMDAADETTKAEKLAQHVASVRQKIDQLAKKKYPKVLSDENKDRNYLPITAMFVPYEAPLMEALKAEPSLWQYAAENNVILITPLTLLAYIRLVYLAWQHEKEARNQAEIVNTARELLVRTNSFLKTFEDIGTTIGSLTATYEQAKGILVDAPHAHTIANSARKLIDLHVRLESKKGKKIETARCLKDSEDDTLELPLQDGPDNGNGQ